MSRRNRWTYSTPEDWMSPQEHRALKAELLALLMLLVVAAVTMFGEQIMDLLGVGLK